MSASRGSLSSSNLDELEPCRDADTLCVKLRRLGTSEPHGVAGAEREATRADARDPGEILELLTWYAADSGTYKLDFLGRRMILTALSRREGLFSRLRVDSLEVCVGLVGCGGDSQAPVSSGEGANSACRST